MTQSGFQFHSFKCHSADSAVILIDVLANCCLSDCHSTKCDSAVFHSVHYQSVGASSWLIIVLPTAIVMSGLFTAALQIGFHRSAKCHSDKCHSAECHSSHSQCALVQIFTYDCMI